MADDSIDRRLSRLTVVDYDIPQGCGAGYYPEFNVLVPLWHMPSWPRWPAAKSVPVRIVREEAPHKLLEEASSDMISGHLLCDAGRGGAQCGIALDRGIFPRLHSP